VRRGAVCSQPRKSYQNCSFWYLRPQRTASGGCGCGSVPPPRVWPLLGHLQDRQPCTDQVPAGGEGDIVVVDALPVPPLLLALVERHVAAVLLRPIGCYDAWAAMSHSSPALALEEDRGGAPAMAGTTGCGDDAGSSLSQRRSWSS
jgi:hypothetical protein